MDRSAHHYSPAYSSRAADLMSTATLIAREIAPRADEIDAHRSLPQDIARRFAEAGIYDLLKPRLYGGLETHPQVFLDIIEQLATVSGSAAWCAFIGATSAYCVAYLPEEEVRRSFDQAGLIMAGVFAPRGKAIATSVKGVRGFQVQGRWPWASGSRNADFIIGGCLELDAAGKPLLLPNGKPQVRSMIFSKHDITLLDTWQASGLCGSGSGDFEVKDVFVPEARTFSLFTDRPLGTPLYSFPVFGLLGLGIAAVCLGLARNAIDTLVALAQGKRPDGSSKLLADSSATQIDVAEAEALVRAARAYLLQTLNAAWDAASASGLMSLGHRRDVRHATTHAVRSAARAVDLMYHRGGGSAVYKSSPLQRHFRDVHVATQHMMVSEATQVLTGRLFLGLPTETLML